MQGGEGIRALTDLGCRGIRRKKTKSREAETQSEDGAVTVLLPRGTGSDLAPTGDWCSKTNVLGKEKKQLTQCLPVALLTLTRECF